MNSRSRTSLARRTAVVTAVVLVVFTGANVTGQPRLNGKIVFSRVHASGDSQIFVINADGSGAAQISNSCHKNIFGSPSPDGTQVVFVSGCPDGNDEIYTMGIDGSNLKRLTNNSSEDTTPVWSPDGNKIAFASSRDFSSQLFLMNTDGTDQRRLTTNTGGHDIHPAWSPDGTKLAFSRLRPGQNYEIYVMKADGTGLVNLTNNTGNDYWPSWSPDGAKITFASLRNSSQNIYVMNADGSNQIKLTSLAGDSAPTWSPDGSKIIFSSIINGHDDLYSMNHDGTNLTRITSNPLHDSYPRWQSTFEPSFRPTVITEANSSRAIALDSVTMQREPFSIIATHNFSSDQTTRLALFTIYVKLSPGEDLSAITVQAEDPQGNVFLMPVESAVPLPAISWITQINVKLPSGLTGDVKLKLTFRNVTSNEALVQIQ